MKRLMIPTAFGTSLKFRNKENFLLSPEFAGVVEKEDISISAGFVEIEPRSGIMLPEMRPCLPVGPEPAFLFHPEPDPIRTIRWGVNPTQLGVIDPFSFFKFFERLQTNGNRSSHFASGMFAHQAVGWGRAGIFKVLYGYPWFPRLD